MTPGTVITGTRGVYRWLTTTEDYMGTVVRSCPDVLVGRYLAVTSRDSGVPTLTEEQRAAGWSLRGGIASSPRLDSVNELQFQRDTLDGPGYDEWYVFDAPSDLGEVITGNPFEEPLKPGGLMAFVNWPAFVLHDPNPAEQVIVEMFWEQIGWVQPDSYIADGRDCLTFVSRNANLFESVRERLSAERQLRCRDPGEVR